MSPNNKAQEITITIKHFEENLLGFISLGLSIIMQLKPKIFKPIKGKNLTFILKQ